LDPNKKIWEDKAGTQVVVAKSSDLEVALEEMGKSGLKISQVSQPTSFKSVGESDYLKIRVTKKLPPI